MENFVEEFEDFIIFVSENPLAKFLLIVAIFLLLREIICWYWKINDRYEFQKAEFEKLKQITEFQVEQLNMLEKILKALEKQPEKNDVLDKAATSDEDSDS